MVSVSVLLFCGDFVCLFVFNCHFERNSHRKGGTLKMFLLLVVMFISSSF